MVPLPGIETGSVVYETTASPQCFRGLLVPLGGVESPRFRLQGDCSTLSYNGVGIFFFFLLSKKKQKEKESISPRETRAFWPYTSEAALIHKGPHLGLEKIRPGRILEDLGLNLLLLCSREVAPLVLKDCPFGQEIDAQPRPRTRRGGFLIWSNIHHVETQASAVLFRCQLQIIRPSIFLQTVTSTIPNPGR